VGYLPARRFTSGATDTSTPTVMLFGKGFAKDKANGDRAPAEEESADDTVVAAADSEEDGDTTASATEELSDEEITNKEEDDHVAALKEEIKNLESELKGKKATLSRIEEDVDKYTKTGYARRVAQMEDMRRIRLVRLQLNDAFVNDSCLLLVARCKEESDPVCLRPFFIVPLVWTIHVHPMFRPTSLLTLVFRPIHFDLATFVS
jgi:uncharacterized small protein (DUF1192 family)